MASADQLHRVFAIKHESKHVSNHDRKEISNNNISEMNKVMHLLTKQYKMMNVSQISDLLRFIHIDNTKPQLFSFIFDGYHLIRYKELCENKLYSFSNMSQFMKKYPKFVNEIISNYRSNIGENETNIIQLFSNIYDQYSTSFGNPLTGNPEIKMKDSIYAFMSYIFGMNLAIKNYIEPQPAICPMIVDLWIVPNRTATINGVEIDNDIGNIKQRLLQNKVTHIKSKCDAGNIETFSKRIRKCLFSSKIKNAMDRDNIHRLIFIVDRRYKKQSDSLYCIVPPQEYGHIVKDSPFDVLNLCHLYCSSNYLLPNTSEYDTNIRSTHIGSTSYLKGYMFNLSFLIYEYKESEIDDTQIFQNMDIFESKTKLTDSDAEYDDTEYDGTQFAKNKEDSNTKRDAKRLSHDDDKTDDQIYNDEEEYINITDLSQMSTANVKIIL